MCERILLSLRLRSPEPSVVFSRHSSANHFRIQHLGSNSRMHPGHHSTPPPGPAFIRPVEGFLVGSHPLSVRPWNVSRCGEVTTAKVIPSGDSLLQAVRKGQKTRSFLEACKSSSVEFLGSQTHSSPKIGTVNELIYIGTASRSMTSGGRGPPSFRVTQGFIEMARFWPKKPEPYPLICLCFRGPTLRTRSCCG